MSTNKDTTTNGLPRELDRKFGQARLRIRAMSAAKGLALVVLTALAAFALAVVLDRVFYLQTPFRVLVLVAALAALALCLVANLALPLLRRYTARQIALSVEDRHPRLGDVVVSTVELSETRAAGQLTTSSQLVDALAGETLDRTRDVDFRSVAPFAAIRWALVLALVLAGIVGAYCIAEPLVAQNVFVRILNPTADIPPFTHTSLAVEPGSVAVAKGSNVQVAAIASGRVPAQGKLAWRRERGRWKRRSIAGDSNNAYQFTFKNVLRPIEYRFRAGDARTATYSIVPIEAPAIIRVAVAYHYPDYTGRGEQPGPSSGGNIRVLRGTRASVTATATKPVESAWVVFAGGTRADLDVRGATVGPLRLIVNTKTTYTFHLRDKHGFTNAEPVPYTIVPLPDREPEITITEPRGSLDRTTDMDVPVRFMVRDDFGLSAMRFLYHATTKTPADEKDRTPEDDVHGALPIELPQPGTTEFAAEYLLELSTLELRPGMVLRYWFEATDNDTVDGPKTGRSVERTITIISDEDSFNVIEREQLALQRRLRKIIEQQAANKKLTEQLETELADTAELSPEEADRLDEAKRAEDAIAESTKELAHDFDATTAKMEENPLIEMKSVMRMKDMKGALADLARREMARASSQLKSAREAQRPDERSRQLDRAEKTEQKILDALNRIDEQFDKLQDEQRLLSLAKSARGMARQQDKNADQTREARRDLSGKPSEQLDEEQKRRLKKLVDRERKLQEKLEEFEEQMQRTMNQLEHKGSEDAKAVENALESMKQSGLADKLQQAMEDLQANHLNKSLKPQKEASDTLWEMAKRLEAAQMAKLGGEFQNIEQAMQEQISEIDRLIELEREIIGSTQKLPAGEEARDDGEEAPDDGDLVADLLDRYGKVEESQTRLHERAGDFRDLLAEIFEQIVVVGLDPVTPLRAAVNSMRDAAGRLGELKRGDALADEQRALEDLIEARGQLAQALAKMMAESQMSMMQQGLDKLAEIIEKQRKINEDTKETDAQRPSRQELSAAFRRLIERLGNRQGRLGDEVVELGRQFQRLRKIGEKMGEVSTMLKELRTGKDTQTEQDKILTALMQLQFQLQAQMDAMMMAAGMTAAAGRSGTGNRDGSQQRPRLTLLPEGGLADMKLPDRLRRELLQAWSEKYPESFRELLSLYYRRLSDEENPY